MLLHRFPVKVTDSGASVQAKNTMSILVSMYRRNVDTNYQNLIRTHIADGKLDQYVCMMIVCLVNGGTKYSLAALKRKNILI